MPEFEWAVRTVHSDGTVASLLLLPEADARCRMWTGPPLMPGMAREVVRRPVPEEWVVVERVERPEEEWLVEDGIPQWLADLGGGAEL